MSDDKSAAKSADDATESLPTEPVATPSAANAPSMPAAAEHNDDAAGDDSENASKPGILHESLRRMLLGGASALLTTEEGIRSLIAERRLPKEVLSTLLAQTDKTRRDIAALVGREIKQTIGKLDVAGEIRKAVSGLRFEVQANVRIHDERAPAAAPSTSATDGIAATAATSEGEPAGPKD